EVKKRGDEFYLIIRPVSEVMLLSNNSNIDFSRTDHAVMMKEQIEAYINGEISKTMSIIQQTGADVFHFDRYLDVRYPKEFQEIKENWRGYYRNHLKLDIQSEVNLRRKGSVMKSFGSVIEADFDSGNSDNGEKDGNSDNSDN